MKDRMGEKDGVYAFWTNASTGNSLFSAPSGLYVSHVWGGNESVDDDIEGMKELQQQGRKSRNLR
jgi:hypothetical protein